MKIDTLIDAARAAMADNPHKIGHTQLSFALERLLGRREALAQVQHRMEAIAEDLAGALHEPLGAVAGLAFEDEHFSKGTLAGLLGNLRCSVREVANEIERFAAAKAEHCALLNRYCEAA